MTSDVLSISESSKGFVSSSVELGLREGGREGGRVGGREGREREGGKEGGREDGGREGYITQENVPGGQQSAAAAFFACVM